VGRGYPHRRTVLVHARHRRGGAHVGWRGDLVRRSRTGRDDTITATRQPTPNALGRFTPGASTATYRIEGKLTRNLHGRPPLQSAISRARRPASIQRSWVSTEGELTRSHHQLRTPWWHLLLVTASGPATSGMPTHQILDALESYVRAKTRSRRPSPTDGNGCFDIGGAATERTTASAPRRQLCFDPTYAGSRG